MRLALLLLAAMAGTALGACSSQQAYATGQVMQRNECNRIVDTQDRQRCMARANMPYDTYQREAEQARGHKP